MTSQEQEKNIKREERKIESAIISVIGSVAHQRLQAQHGFQWL